jgi:SPASM domain peptide maturase of grasp-with-spasm system
MGKYLTLYPTCVIVKGAIRSTITDLEKNDFHYIPNDFSDVVAHLQCEDYSKFLQTLSLKDQLIIEEYIEFIIAKDLGFFTEKPELYPQINLQFYPHSKIVNAILDRNHSSTYNIFSAITELDTYNCQHLQLRFYSESSIDELDLILKHIQESDILSVEIFYKYNSDKLPRLKKLINKWTKIKLLLVHSAPYSNIFTLNKGKYYTSNMGTFIYTDEIIGSEQNCGIISFSYFTINLSTFSESFHHNTCLKNKLSIDVNGKIKNCPTLEEDYGVFKTGSLGDVLKNTEYLSYGEIKKDDITVCKDCEHRHFCTDCRAFVANKLEKPMKCSYNPYTAKWDGTDSSSGYSS